MTTTNASSYLGGFIDPRTFTLSGSITVPPWAKRLVIHRMCGGGGSGSGGNGTTNTGGGAAAEAFSGNVFPVTPGQTITYNVAVAVAGGASAADGNDGQNSSITNGVWTLTARGGKKGRATGGTAGVSGGGTTPGATIYPMPVPFQAPGGAGIGSGTKIPNLASSCGPYLGGTSGADNTNIGGGAGGASLFANGKNGGDGSAAGAGVNGVSASATDYGAGGGSGGGGVTNGNGGAGGPGLIEFSFEG